MTEFVGLFFLDYLSGYIREVLDYAPMYGDDKYKVSVPNQGCFEIVHRDFIVECVERAGTR